MTHPGEAQKQERRIKKQDEEEMLKMHVNREGATPLETQEQAHSRKRTMEEVISPNNMEEINRSDKR